MSIEPPTHTQSYIHTNSQTSNHNDIRRPSSTITPKRQTANRKEKEKRQTDRKMKIVCV